MPGLPTDCARNNKAFGSLRGREFTNQLNYCHLLKKTVQHVITTVLIIAKAGDGGDAPFHGFADSDPLGAPQEVLCCMTT
jgi:hypothetical protein